MLKHGKFRGCTLSPADVDTAAELLGKSRLVAGGHRQHEATFSTTSSPTVDISSVFLSLGLSTFLPQCTIHNTDIPAAYLHCSLKDTIFMRLPKSLAGILVKYNAHLKEYLDNNGSIVVKLLRSLYGLKQSSAEWYKVSNVDKCVFFKRNDSGYLSILLVTQYDAVVGFLSSILLNRYGELEFSQTICLTWAWRSIVSVMDRY